MKTCRYCKQLLAKKKDTSGNFRYRYVDQNNRMWHGRACPDCYIKKASLNNQLYKLKVGFEYPVRKCRECGQSLPPTHYFRHPKCTPNTDVNVQYEEFVYV